MLYGEIDLKSLRLDLNELAARLGVPVNEIPTDIEQVWRELAAVSGAAFCAERVDVKCADGAVHLGNLAVKSAALLRVLSGCSRAVLLTVTLGHGAERFLRGRAMLGTLRHFLADAVADAAIEAAADFAQKEVLGAGGHTARFSPGYADFHLSFVRDIVDLTGAGRLGISVSREFLMTPTKTVCAVIGIKKEVDDNGK